MCVKDPFCIHVLWSHMISLSLRLSCFVSNPLLLPWIYYTAESICDGIEAIKGFIYPYLKPIPKKLPSIIQSETYSAGRIFFLYPFIKKSYSVSLFIVSYCHRFKAGKRPPWAAEANVGGAPRWNKKNEASGLLNQASSLTAQSRKAITKKFQQGICFCAFIFQRTPVWDAGGAEDHFGWIISCFGNVVLLLWDMLQANRKMDLSFQKDSRESNSLVVQIVFSLIQLRCWNECQAEGGSLSDGWLKTHSSSSSSNSTGLDGCIAHPLHPKAPSGRQMDKQMFFGFLYWYSPMWTHTGQSSFAGLTSGFVFVPIKISKLSPNSCQLHHGWKFPLLLKMMITHWLLWFSDLVPGPGFNTLAAWMAL